MKMNNSWLKGIWPVIPTPLQEDEAFDPEGLKAVLEYAISQKFHGVLILGSNGESPYFSLHEKKQILQTAGESIGSRLPWMAGILENSTRNAIVLADAAEKAGANALLVALPTYYPISISQAILHMKRIAQRTNLPLLYYHFPSCTHLKFSPKDVGLLCQQSGAVGIKESIVSLPEMKRHLQLVRRKRFALFCGTSYLLKGSLKIGGRGAICPLPLLLPNVTLSLYASLQQGSSSRINALEEKIFATLPIVSGTAFPQSIAHASLKLLSKTMLSLKASGVEGLPALIKEGLRMKGLPILSKVRSPLPQITEKQKGALRHLLDTLGETGKGK